MAKPPPIFLTRLRGLPSPFTTTEAEALFPDLKPTSVRVYLSHAARAGLIEPVGRKRFQHRVPSGPGHHLTPLMQAVIDKLRGELMPSAVEQLVVWGDDALAPFLHDAFVDPFVVIEGHEATIKAAERILRADRTVELVAQKHGIGERLFAAGGRGGPTPRVFLAATGNLNGTTASPHGFQVPAVGRLVNVVLQTEALAPDVASVMMESSLFRLDDAIAASPSKKAAARLGAFIAAVLNEQPDHPVRDQAKGILLRTER